MRAAFKNTIRNLPLFKVCRGPVSHLPIEHWPSVLGRIYGVATISRIKRMQTPSAQCGSNIRIIFDLLKSVTALPGDVAECGVYQGASLIPVGLYLRQHKIPKLLFAFDSFEGFDRAVLADIA